MDVISGPAAGWDSLATGSTESFRLSTSGAVPSCARERISCKNSLVRFVRMRILALEHWRRFMKIIHSVVASTIAIVGLSVSAWAAPVASVESARASVARQKVDAFLNEKVVVEQLTALGLSQQQVHARIAQLSEAQLQQLAAQVDLLRAGGTIQGGDLERLGPLGYLGRQLRLLCQNIYKVLFTWGDIK
jgi:uncharacterized protein DUF6627